MFDFHYTYEEDGDSNMPIITLEVLADATSLDYLQNTTVEIPTNAENTTDASGMHFITENVQAELIQKVDNDKDESKDAPKVRTDLLEYMTRNDGSVICKLCGEILQSRTHWYRHKYKLHVVHPLNPSPLFQCEQCLVFFKSRKGYIGHLASRHSEILSDSSPVLTNSQAESVSKEQTPVPKAPPDAQEEPDPELSIPKTSVPNYQNNTKPTATKSTETKKPHRGRDQPTNQADWEEKRSKEEKLVADIIDRVRRECEAQGAAATTRKGYSRRTTVMHT